MEMMGGVANVRRRRWNPKEKTAIAVVAWFLLLYLWFVHPKKDQRRFLLLQKNS